MKLQKLDLRDGVFKSVSDQGPLGPVSEEHCVLNNGSLPYTSKGG